MRSNSDNQNSATPFIIYGAGGHGKVVFDIARSVGKAVSFFLDDGEPNSIETVPTLSTTDSRWAGIGDFEFLVALGNNVSRCRIFAQLLQRGGKPVSLRHSFTSISDSATIGKGTVLCAGAVISASAEIGENCIVNTGATIDHDCRIFAHCHICPGSHLAGNVAVGSGTMIGTGSSVIPGIRIGENCLIGAGSTVVEDVPGNSVAYGTPARIVRPNDLFLFSQQ